MGGEGRAAARKASTRAGGEAKIRNDRAAISNKDDGGGGYGPTAASRGRRGRAAADGARGRGGAENAGRGARRDTA